MSLKSRIATSELLALPFPEGPALGLMTCLDPLFLSLDPGHGLPHRPLAEPSLDHPGMRR
jgi:hypothetical protein